MLQIGEVVDGKYKILNKIGQGGMSVVYLAMNERANKQWAIKEVRKDGMSNFEVVRQGLIAETDLLKKLNHPNLPSIIDVIDEQDTFLIVMDYIEGNSLSSALKDYGAQPQEDVIEWAKELCDVLGYLHSRKPPIIYRDMKPSNVMLKPDGTVTLIDFGTAREFKSTSVADTTCLGTQGYAAPEQFGGQGQTDARTDIYCLGATLYHLVTGHNPCDPPYEMYPIRQWNPALSSGLEEIIIKCTQKNPADRYQSCAELMYALEHYDELDETYRKKQRRKWKGFLTASISAAVMLFATIGFGVAENIVTANSYDYYVEKAENSSDKATSYDYYKKAISLDPAKEDGYEKLMAALVNGDNVFSEDENNYLTRDINIEQKLEMLKDSNEDAYGRVCYQLAKNYFFYYSEDGGTNTISGKEASKSVIWYKEASKYYEDDGTNNSVGSTTDVRKRAESMMTLAELTDKMNKGSLGAKDFTGENSNNSSYKEYFEKLSDIARDETEVNYATVVRSSKLLINSLIIPKISSLKEEGVSSEQLNAALNSVEGRLKQINDPLWQEEINKLINGNDSDIKTARDVIISAYDLQQSTQEQE